MHIQFTNTDSTGAPVTKSLSITLGDTRYNITVAETGSANVPREVGEYLIRSDEYAVEAFESPADETEAETNAEADTDDGDSDEEPEPIIEQDSDTTADADTADDDGGDDSDDSVLPDAITDRL